MARNLSARRRGHLQQDGRGHRRHRTGQGKNIFALGLLARIFDLNVPKLNKLIEERFGGKDPTVVQNAVTCFEAGVQSPASGPAQTTELQHCRR